MQLTISENLVANYNANKRIFQQVQKIILAYFSISVKVHVKLYDQLLFSSFIMLLIIKCFWLNMICFWLPSYNFYINYPFIILFTYRNEPRYEKTSFFAYAKTKTQISFAVTAMLISAFVFAIRIVQSLYFLNRKFQASRHLL